MPRCSWLLDTGTHHPLDNPSSLAIGLARSQAGNKQLKNIRVGLTKLVKSSEINLIK